MDNQFNSLLSVAMLPRIIQLIVDKEGVSDTEAINMFYKSETYRLLTIEETKMWHYSVLNIYTIWKNETITGKVEYPEGL